MGAVDGIVLSHGHWDHGGAMLRALEMIQMNNGGREVPTYMHPGMYRTRATRTPDASMHLFEDVTAYWGVSICREAWRRSFPRRSMRCAHST
jgi:metal-dependent hydrolase (beta-lactamase superfamily II)